MCLGKTAKGETPYFLSFFNSQMIPLTHIDNGGSGAGVLGHPPASFVLKSPTPERPVVYVCVRLTGLP